MRKLPVLAALALLLAFANALAAQSLSFAPGATGAATIPGAGVAVPVTMTGVQNPTMPKTFGFDASFDGAKLIFVSATAGTPVSTAGAALNANLNGAGDTVSVSCVNPGAQTIAEGTVVTLNFTVKQGASATVSAANPGSAFKLFISATIAANGATTIASIGGGAAITFRPGVDVNLNGSVNVADVQNTVNIILATAAPAYAKQGDANKSGSVTVADVQLIVNNILAPVPFPAVTTAILPSGNKQTAFPSTTLAVTSGTPPYTWALTGGSLPTGMTLTSAGVLSGTPTNSGTFTPEITVTDSASVSATMFYTLSVSGGTLTSIVITPSPATVNIGGTTQLTATGHYSDASTANITTQVVWSSSLPSAVTVGAGTGMLTGMSTGNCMITATDTATSVTANVTVNVLNPLVLISIAPSPLSVNHQATANLAATGTFANSSTSNVTTSVNWTSANSSIASVGLSTGIVTGVAPGSTVITATDPTTNVTKTVNVTVNVVLSSLTVTPSSPSVVQGLTTPLVATANFSDSTSSTVTSTAAWSSATTSKATVSVAGVVTGVAAGTSVITASITINGTTKQGSVTVTVTAPVLTQITISPSPSTVNAAATVQFSAIGTYNNNTNGALTTGLVWTSSVTAKATINGAGLATGVAAGTTNITATSGTIVSNISVLTVSAALVSYAATIQPIWTSRCTNCHSGSGADGGLKLTSYALLAAGGNHGAQYTPGNHNISIIYTKCTNTPPFGVRMPEGSSALTSTQLQAIADWIDQGALNN
jgi:uncharacterized protein YjdB